MKRFILALVALALLEPSAAWSVEGLCARLGKTIFTIVDQADLSDTEINITLPRDSQENAAIVLFVDVTSFTGTAPVLTFSLFPAVAGVGILDNMLQSQPITTAGEYWEYWGAWESTASFADIALTNVNIRQVGPIPPRFRLKLQVTGTAVTDLDVTVECWVVAGGS